MMNSTFDKKELQMVELIENMANNISLIDFPSLNVISLTSSNFHFQYD